ncbi:MAG: response regulator [Rhodoferax sp.]|uniref:response regulator n=1 Tax=Rhodoferax sp. TaxID=50421 RepID=UPI002612527A|nr:response regulator [Rhodoferax sp.]MDD2882657.1 response regulator [Rhodoferax sp.]
MNFDTVKVLVIDDDPIMISYVVNLLQRIGVGQVIQAKDGSTGLAIAASDKPDVILSDIHMTPMDGLEFVRNLRKHPVTDLRRTPVLIMSADSSTDKLNEALPLGIAGYIVKPPAISALQVKLEQALKFRYVR